MASNFLAYNQTGQYGAQLKTPLVRFEDAFTDLNEIFGAMQKMIDGDGSQDSHYAVVQANFGFKDDSGAASNTVAHTAFNELSSLLGKLNSDASQTNVHAAMLQLFNEFR